MFCLKLAGFFLSAMTLKIRSRSQRPNQGFSKCCIHANAGQNQVISSGDIEQIITFGLNLACVCLQ